MTTTTQYPEIPSRSSHSQTRRRRPPAKLASRALATVLFVGAVIPLLAFVAATEASAAATCQRFVATEGSDSWEGTQQRPFRSLDKLVSSLRPGQAGCILAGTTYHATQGNGIVRGNGGTAGNPVTITTGGTGAPAKVYGQVDVQPAAHDITLTGLDFIGTDVLADGTPRVPRGTHLNLRGDRLTLRRSTVTNPYGICINAGTTEGYNHTQTGDPADDLVITENVVTGCGMSPKLVWQPEMSGAHGIYIVWTRNARITENVITNNRYRGFQSWPRSEGTLLENNLFDANATHVNLGSVLGERYPWKTTTTIVRNNIMVNKTGWVPEKNHASVVGNFPRGDTYGNRVESNCIDPASTAFAGNGFVTGTNESAKARFVDRARGDYRLTADSPCRGKGPARLQPTAEARPTDPSQGRQVTFAPGRCVDGRVQTNLPQIRSGSVEGEWVFHRVDLVRWDGQRWVRVGFEPWRYAKVGTAGTMALGTATQHWATFDQARSTSPAAGAISSPAPAGPWYALHQTVWFADGGATESTWTNLGADGLFCRN